MDRKEIEELVLRNTRDHLGTTLEETKLESNFIDDLGADSLDIIELAMMFEEDFSVEIKDDDIDNIKTLKDAVDLIEKERARR